MKSCGTCQYWSFQEVSNVKNRVARCLWPIPPMPSSLTANNGIWLGYMGKNDGADCPTYKVKL